MEPRQPVGLECQFLRCAQATLCAGRPSTYADARMRHVLLSLLHLAVMAAKLCGPGGVRAVIAENLLLKQQLIVRRRARQRAPNLLRSDRLLCGFWSLVLSPGRIRTVAVALRPSTLLASSSRSPPDSEFETYRTKADLRRPSNGRCVCLAGGAHCLGQSAAPPDEMHAVLAPVPSHRIVICLNSSTGKDAPRGQAATSMIGRAYPSVTT